MANSSSSSSSAGPTLTGAGRKEVDLYAAVADASLADSVANLTINSIENTIIRGDMLLLRWTFFSDSGNTASFKITPGDKAEFIVTTAFNATKSEIVAYSDHSQVNIPGDWDDANLGSGKISFRVDMDSYALLSDIGTDKSKVYKAGLVLTPAGTAEHVWLWIGEINLKNDVYRFGQGGSPIVLNPPSASIMSSSSSSSTVASLTSSSSSSASSSSSSSSSKSSSSSSCSSSSSQSKSSASSLSSSSVSVSSSSSSSSSSTVAGLSTTSVSSTSESSANTSSSTSVSSLSSTSESSVQ